MSKIPLITNAKKIKDCRAIIASEGTFTYGDLLEASEKISYALLEHYGSLKNTGVNDLNETRVASIVTPGFEYAAVQWGIWRAGGIAVPLSVTHPLPELEFVITDSGAEILVAHPEFESKLRPISESLRIKLVLTKELLRISAQKTLPSIHSDRRALLLYTSGTAGSPKGVVTTHSNIEAQTTAVVTAWEWSPNDHILHVLPLHHCSGIILVLTSSLRSGGICEILPRFEVDVVWERILNGNLTLFLAVPTIYVKLIAAWKAADRKQRKLMSDACKRLRIMISGSAPLPVSVLKEWKHISGHTILERYGMTELGGAIAHPLHGERVPGAVGIPLPGIEAKLIDENGDEAPENIPGEILVKGPLVFREYWGKPELTKESFDGEWFRTGDIAVIENGNYRIIGRSSIDTIKTGGHKVSAREIEETLLMHPSIKECVVVGVDDPEWGERVSAVLVLEPGSKLTLETLRIWGKERLASYKVPSQILIRDTISRNVMGKVSKPDIKKLFKK